MNGVPGAMMRGGTSKGAFFVAHDLPSDPDARDRLLMQMMGTPDPRQIDGMGGAHPLTTKVAVVSPSNDDDVDLDYLFLQLGVAEPVVSDRQNCGNMLAAVGPFALERGLITAPSAEEMAVRIRMLNTDGLAVARFRVAGGRPVYDGQQEISGVPGTASPVFIDFEDIAGGSSGALLPTGNVVDEVAGVPATLVDNGMPVVVLAAEALGVTGYETCAELEANDGLREQLEAIRVESGLRMNLGDVTRTTVPKLTLVARPKAGGAISTRTFIPHRCHQAIGVLGAVSVATACQIPGSPAADLAEVPGSDVVRLEHPTGTFDAVVEMDGTEVIRAGIVRTARMLMDGTFYPRSY